MDGGSGSSVVAEEPVGRVNDTGGSEEVRVREMDDSRCAIIGSVVAEEPVGGVNDSGGAGCAIGSSFLLLLLLFVRQ